MASVSSLWICTLLSLCFINLHVAALRIYELPSRCNKDQKIIDVPSPKGGSLSSGILVDSIGSTYFSNKFCSFLLVPERGSNILLSIKKIDLRSGCKDNVTVFTTPTTSTVYCGEIKNDKETSTLVSNGTMTINFQTGPGIVFGRRGGFELIFTSFTNSSTPCYESSLFRCGNGRCISTFLTCDGHNHCGDRSDQKKCGPSGGAIAGYTIGAIFLIIAFVAGIIYCTRRQRRVVTTTTYPTRNPLTPPPYQPSMYPTPPQGYSGQGAYKY